MNPEINNEHIKATEIIRRMYKWMKKFTNK